MATGHGLGLLLIGCVTVLWVSASVVIQHLFEEKEVKAPFLITYYSTCVFSVYLLGFLFRPSWRRIPWSAPVLKSPPRSPHLHPMDSSPQKEIAIPAIPMKQILKLSAFFCPLRVLSNYTFNASLALTTVSSITIISTTSSVWAFAMSVWFLGEAVTWTKVVSIVFTLAGVIATTVNDHQQSISAASAETPTSSSEVIGDLLALLSAALYGSYTVLLQIKVKDERTLHFPIFFGFVGLFNMVVFAPVIPMLGWLGIEHYQSFDLETAIVLFLNAAAATVLADYLWARAVLLTSPLVATLGLTLTLPLAMLVDFVMAKSSVSFLSLLGSGFIVLGFALSNAPSSVVIRMEDALSAWLPSSITSRLFSRSRASYNPVQSHSP